MAQDRSTDTDDDDDGPLEDQPMSLFEHLEELRSRLIRAIVWLALGTAVAWYFKDEILAIIVLPLEQMKDQLDERQIEIIVTKLGGKFFVSLKAALAFGIFIAGPFVLREIWAFVAPGLYPKERRWVVLYAPFSYLLFASGAAFFYFVVQPAMIEFFFDFGSGENLLTGTTLEVNEKIDIEPWFALWTGMLVIMGVIFQLPLIMLVAASTGVVDAGTFRAYRRHFIVGSVIAAAFITPTGDAVTLSLTMVPIVLLYEVGVLLTLMLGRRKQEDDA